MQVRFVPYKDIDKKKWDECIRLSENRLIYAQSFYLDAMAEAWDALIADDYKAVMPLPCRKKFTIKYLYEPPFIQQLGVFFTNEISPVTYKLFEEQLLKKYKFGEITLNYKNADAAWNSAIKRRSNFILDLNKPYEELYNNYLPAFTKSLRRIKKFQLQYSVSDDYNAAIDHYKKNYGKLLPDFGKPAYEGLKKICSRLHPEGQLFVREVYSEDSNLLAGVVLLSDANRLYNIISFITAEGKKLEANYCMYDEIIREFSAKGYLLDLEGSDVKGVSDFYKKMNPVNQSFLFLRFNNLHPLIKLIKP
jgi:hypothetical protein